MANEATIVLTIKNTGDGFDILKKIFENFFNGYSEKKYAQEEINGWLKWVIDNMVGEWMIYDLEFIYATHNEFRIRVISRPQSYASDFLGSITTLFPELTIAAIIGSTSLNYQLACGYAPDIPLHLNRKVQLFKEDATDIFDSIPLPLSDESIQLGKRFSRFPFGSYIRDTVDINTSDPLSKANDKSHISGQS